MTSSELLAQFQRNVPLSTYCTLSIGGPAAFFIEVSSVDEMRNAIVDCSRNNIRFMILGKGSNCLFDDRGFDGAVIVNKIDFMSEIEPGTFEVGAGYSFALLGVQTARKGWSGLEFASGIPATVGGAVYMNAGANGCETAQALKSVDFMDVKGSLHTYFRAELDYAYRYSPFQKMKGSIISATFHLHQDANARKKQIEIVNYRKNTQPYGSKSAGCVFLNPPGQHAGALIEKMKLKGVSVGGAQVSSRHANFLVNTGTATCNEMLQLIEDVRLRVKESTGVELCSEIRQIPFKEDC